MQRVSSLTLAVALVMMALVAGLSPVKSAQAQGWFYLMPVDQVSTDGGSTGSGGRPGGQGMRRPHGHPGTMMMAMAATKNLELEVVAALAGVDPATIESALEESSMREVMESYNIDRDAFRSGLDDLIDGFLDKAVTCGLITQEQAEGIKAKLEEMEANRPEEGSEETAPF